MLCMDVARLYAFFVTTSRMKMASDDDKRQRMIQSFNTCMSGIAYRSEPRAPGDANFNHNKAVDKVAEFQSCIVTELNTTSLINEE